MGYIIFNGASSRDIGMEVETFPARKRPALDCEATHITGRSGDLLYSRKAFANVEQEYVVSIWDGRTAYSDLLDRVNDWLYGNGDYARLEDSYDPEHYRLAYYAADTDFDNLFNEAGRGTITFVCKPQRFLKTGEITLTFTASGGKIMNPTPYPAAPLLRVYGSAGAKMQIAGEVISFESWSTPGDFIDIDCELMDAYTGTVNQNSRIRCDAFPVLPGNTVSEITWTGNISKVIVWPRWWRL